MYVPYSINCCFIELVLDFLKKLICHCQPFIGLKSNFNRQKLNILKIKCSSRSKNHLIKVYDYFEFEPGLPYFSLHVPYSKCSLENPWNCFVAFDLKSLFYYFDVPKSSLVHQIFNPSHQILSILNWKFPKTGKNHGVRMNFPRSIFFRVGEILVLGGPHWMNFKQKFYIWRTISRLKFLSKFIKLLNIKLFKTSS